MLLYGFCAGALLSTLPAPAREIDFEWNLGAGCVYRDVRLKGDFRSDTETTALEARLRAVWTFADRWLVSVDGVLPVLEENTREKSFANGAVLQQNDCSVRGYDVRICGGIKLAALARPFLGIALSEWRIDRFDAHSVESFGDHALSARDLLAGIEGTLALNDDLLVGYRVDYRTSPFSRAEFHGVDFENVDTRRFDSEVFLKYWMPNELFQVGVHLYGGRVRADDKALHSRRLPDTDIRFAGGFVSVRVNL
jgi:hypothetical protein